MITQTRDIMRGVLVGNEAKETKIQKYKQQKRWQKMESLQKGCLKIENQRVRENQKQGTRSCFLTKWRPKMLSKITTSY